MRQRSEPGPGTGGSWRAPTEKGQRSPSFALEKKLEEHGAHVDDPNEGGDANFTRMVTRPLDGDHFPHPLEDRGVAYSLPTPPVMLLLQLLLQLLRVQRSCAPVLLGTLRWTSQREDHASGLVPAHRIAIETRQSSTDAGRPWSACGRGPMRQCAEVLYCHESGTYTMLPAAS